MNYFIFNGIASDTYGVYIQSKSIYSSPKYDVSFISVPGRDGDLLSELGRYPNATVVYKCFVAARTIEELSSKLVLIKNWLYKDSGTYHTLKDSYEPLFERKAVYTSKLDIADECRKLGTFTVTFSCKPFRYLITGLESLSLTASGTLTNPYSFSSHPYMKIHGTGEATVSVNGNTWTFSRIIEYIECDSELMNFFKGGVLMNSTVEGTGFPELRPGSNSISFTGDITQIEIIPRWITL